jgi:hypothetical protein
MIRLDSQANKPVIYYRCHAEVMTDENGFKIVSIVY